MRNQLYPNDSLKDQRQYLNILINQCNRDIIRVKRLLRNPFNNCRDIEAVKNLNIELEENKVNKGYYECKLEELK